MKLVEAKPKRLFCSTCDETYNVPQQNGSLKLHQELKCPLDDFELIYFTAGAKGKSFTHLGKWSVGSSPGRRGVTSSSDKGLHPQRRLGPPPKK